jgi:hypothetical protein
VKVSKQLSTAAGKAGFGNFFENGRQPILFGKRKTTSILKR